MQKKIGEIAQAFEHLNFAESLTLIDQTLKKNAKSDKKKGQLSNAQLKIILSFKAGALVSLGRVHEADIVFQQLIQPEGIEIMGKQNPFLLASVSQIFGDLREKKVLESLEKYAPNYANSQFYRFYLNSRWFSALSKCFLKEFMTSKNMLFQLGQVYLEYLQNIDKFGLIQYERDGQYRYHPELKNHLKLVNMFLQKCLKSAQQSKQKQQNDYKQKQVKLNFQQKEKIVNQIKNFDLIIHKANELKLKIAINEGRIADAIQIYTLVSQNSKQPFKFIRSIIKLKNISQQQSIIDRFYISEMQKIFRTNLKLSQYTPYYDYYLQFLNYLINQVKNKGNIKQILVIYENSLIQEDLYQFDHKNLDEVLNKLYASLSSQYSALVDKSNPNYEINVKSDYYKICIKGLLLLLIYINYQIQNENQLNKYLKDYTALFSNTLTYAQQLKRYQKILIAFQIITAPQFVQNDNQLIQKINFTKINLSVNTLILNNYQQTIKIFTETIKLYDIYRKQIQKARKLQKGQRYISDQFIIMLCDYIRVYIENENEQIKVEELVLRIVNELQIIIQNSPYNADLKFRLMYFCSYLNHHQRLIEVFLTNDIKSVQMQTLGYWFLKPALQFGLWDQYDQFLHRMVKSYHENQRQTSEYAFKALKAGQLDLVQQYLCYRDNILSSYNSILILYLLFQKYRFENNSEYYLKKIHDSICKLKLMERKFTFNADFKQMKNQLFQKYGFAQFYGLYNSVDILHKEVTMYLHEQLLIHSLLQKPFGLLNKDLQQLDKLQLGINNLNVLSLYDFKSFSFYQSSIEYCKENSKKTLERNSNYLENFKNVSKIRIGTLQLVNILHQLIQEKKIQLQEISSKVDQFKLSISKTLDLFNQSEYREQTRSIWLIRRAAFQSYNLLNIIRQHVQKNKKFKKFKETVEGNTSKCLEELFNLITVLKLSVAPGEKEGFYSNLIKSRDEANNRQLTMDGKEAKRILLKYQSVYKQ